MISDTQAAVGEVGDDEFEGTGGYIEVREDGDDGIVGHSVECLTEINSCSNDSFRILGGVIKITKYEINSSDDIVDDGAAREASKLVITNVRGNVLPYPLN